MCGTPYAGRGPRPGERAGACPACGGTGTVARDARADGPCPACGGSGHVPRAAQGPERPRGREEDVRP